MEKKTSDAQLRANKKWKEKNKELTKYYICKSTAKNFVRVYATREDMQELNEIFEKENKKSVDNI